MSTSFFSAFSPLCIATPSSRSADPAERSGFLRRFIADEAGAGTAWNIFWMAGFMMLGGVAVDTSNALRVQNHLQIAADSAAHAAVVELYESGYNQNVARAKALEIAADNMPSSQHGSVVDTSEVFFGHFSNGDFTDGGLPTNAVRVIARRETDRGNPVRASLLQLVGLDVWNLNTQAVARIDPPPCYRQGIVAMGTVELSSNNEFGGEICVAGIEGISIRNNNIWEPGVIVTTPGDLHIPNPALNEGLEEALRSYAMLPKFVSSLDTIIPGFADPDFPLMPEWVDTTQETIVVAESSFDSTTLLPNRIYQVLCGEIGNQTLTLSGDIEFVVIQTDCELHLSSHSTYENVVLATSANQANTDAMSVNIGQDVWLGAADMCADGGGAWVFSYGEMHAPAALTLNGGMLVAEGDIHISANADGINGTAIFSGGDIKITSNESFALCPGGSSNPDLYQFALVQ